MNFWIRFLFSAVTWLLYLIPWIILTLLGFIVLPIGWWFGRWRASPIVPGRMIFSPPAWLWLWGNDEEGYCPVDYASAHADWSAFKVAYTWATIRNPVDNLRFVTWLCQPQRADAVRWATRGAWTLVWQGWRARLIYTGTKRSLWLGWHYYPAAKDAEGWMAHGCGFTIKRLLNSEIDPQDSPPLADRA